MPSSKNKRECLSCKHYKPTDETVGRCRLNRGKLDPADYPVMNHQDCCESWRDVGQKYHIRVGWIRGLVSKSKAESGLNDNEVG